jgi:hypothetical protein
LVVGNRLGNGNHSENKTTIKAKPSQNWTNQASHNLTSISPNTL